MDDNILEEKNEEVILRVKINPGSRKFEIGKVNPWRNLLRISTPAPAKKGKANSKLVEELESLLDEKVRISSGKKSRKKILSIKGISKEEIRRKLGLPKE